jgi:hypothetical protein
VSSSLDPLSLSAAVTHVLVSRNSGDPHPHSNLESIHMRRYSTVGGVWDVGRGSEIADRLYSTRLPRTALMNPIEKGRGLPRLLSISVL